MDLIERVESYKVLFKECKALEPVSMALAKTSYVVNQEDGILEVALNSAPNDLTQTILQTMVYGIGSIESQCSQYVRIQEHSR